MSLFREDKMGKEAEKSVWSGGGGEGGTCVSHWTSKPGQSLRNKVCFQWVYSQIHTLLCITHNCHHHLHDHDHPLGHQEESCPLQRVAASCERLSTATRLVTTTMITLVETIGHCWSRSVSYCCPGCLSLSLSSATQGDEEEEKSSTGGGTPPSSTPQTPFYLLRYLSQSARVA